MDKIPDYILEAAENFEPQENFMRSENCRPLDLRMRISRQVFFKPREMIPVPGTNIFPEYEVNAVTYLNLEPPKKYPFGFMTAQAKPVKLNQPGNFLHT